MVNIGIDIGSSTTKIVGFKDGKMIEPLCVKANDPLTSAYGALGRFTVENGLSLGDISGMTVTGVGAARLGKSIYSVDITPVGEFGSVAKGGLYLSGLSKAIVASMGTGTALVYADSEKGFEYLGGTGVGGGTLKGLSDIILGMRNIDHIAELAEKGKLENTDLRVVDISYGKKSISLPGELTAANFGKISELAGKEDLALGIMNMVFETIAMLCIFAARQYGIKDIVLTGHISTVPMAKERFDWFSSIFGVNFIIPERSTFATAIGAALSQ